MYRKWEQISRIRQDDVVVVVVCAFDNAAINCPDKWVIKIIKFSLHSSSSSLESCREAVSKWVHRTEAVAKSQLGHV